MPDYGSPSPSPPPATIHHLQLTTMSDILLYLRRRANDGPADGHSRQRRQQQQEMHLINLDDQIPPGRRPDGTPTTRRYMILTCSPHCPEAATAASPRHRHRATTTPYHRTEHHEQQSNRRRRRSPALCEDDHEGATKQHEMHLINLDDQIPPGRRPDGTPTTRRYMILTCSPHCPEAATAASPRHRHRATTTPYHRTEHHEQQSNRRRRRSPALREDDHEATTATATSPRHCHRATTAHYHRTEHHEGWSNRRRRRSPVLCEDDHEGVTKVVCLTMMLSPGDRLEDDGFYRDFLEDVTKEARKFGDLVKVVIPRPGPGIEGCGSASVVAGVGKVFLEYSRLDDAAWCRRRLDGRWYSRNKIAATFFRHDRFDAGDYA